MTDIVKEAFGFGVNAAGEVVAAIGTGDTTIVGNIGAGLIPVNSLGQLAIVLPDVAASIADVTDTIALISSNLSTTISDVESIQSTLADVTDTLTLLDNIPTSSLGALAYVGADGLDTISLLHWSTDTLTLGIGTATPNAAAKLDLVSTTQGLLPPRMTTAQRAAIASPVAGLIVYDTDLAKLAVYTTAWEAITSVTIV